MLSTLPFECPQVLLEKAKATKRIATAVVGAEGPLALESAKRAQEAGLIEPILVGKRDAIVAAAEAAQWDITDLEVVAAESPQDAAKAAVALARAERAKALMKGQIATDQLMRAVIDRDAGLRTGARMSHVFYMTAPGREGSLTITDAALNVAPDIETRLHIVRNAVGLHHALGDQRPKVAVLSATESPSSAMPSSLEAQEIAKRAQAGEVEGAEVEGPLSLDLAISPKSAAVKGVSGPVAGQADIVIAPNIETGNALFKAMVYFLSATASGLVLGAKVPIVLTSRADPPEARLAAAALAAISASHAD